MTENTKMYDDMNIDSEAALYCTSVSSDHMLYLVMFCLLYSSKKI